MNTFPINNTSCKAGELPLLSVVIPVYNVAPYLRRSLDSICQQDYRNLEIICVDDGSTDESLSILREYEEQDKRIRVIHQENAGVSSARNAGMDVATGEWLTFVDPDDYLLPRAYSTAITFTSLDVDAVFFGIRVEAPESLSNKKQVYQSWLQLPAKGVQRLDPRYLYRGGWSLFNKLYRHSIIKEHNIRFDPYLCVGEDICWYSCFCVYARTVYMHAEPLYTYALRESSATFGKKDYERWTNCFLTLFDDVATAFGKENLISEFAPMFLILLRKIQSDVIKWSIYNGSLLRSHEDLLQLVYKHHLHEEATLLTLFHEMEEQQRTCIRNLKLLNAACESAVDSSSQQGTVLHVAIPVNDARAGMAVILAQSLKAQADRRPVCVHFLCDGVNPLARNRMAEMEEEKNFSVRLHISDTDLLHLLPPLEQAPYPGYLKMALPQILPNISRVLVLDPGLLVTGELPDFNSLDMEGMPVAVAQEWPITGKSETVISNVDMVNYVSSSLILMDLDCMREKNCTCSWMAACMLRPSRLAAPEQNSFNLAFQEKMAFLPLVESWLSKAKVPSIEVASFHRNSPWKDFPLNMNRLRVSPPAPARPAQKAAPQTPKSPAPQAPKSTGPKETNPPASQEPKISHAQLLMAQQKGLLRNYRYYQIMSKLTWGKRSKYYKAKREAYRHVLRDIRTLRREALDSCGLK